MTDKSSTANVVQFGDDVVQRALVATAVCVEKLGFSKVSMDDIVTESGISRATLYRRFGNRDTILSALIQQQAIPFVEESIKVAAAAASLKERLEISTVHAVMEIPRYPSLKAFFDMDALPHSQNLIRPVYRQLVDATLVPTLDAARRSGELRPGLDSTEIIEWLMRNFLLLVADGPWEKNPLLSRIRQYILPVLIKDPDNTPVGKSGEELEVSEQLKRLEYRISEIQQTVGLLRRELSEKS